MLRADTMIELFDAAETLALTQEQHGERLAIVTNGGGAGVLASDALEAAGGDWLSSTRRRSHGSIGPCRQPGATATRST
jgi:acetyltransferase